MLTIGKVAGMAGVSPDTIRYYERSNARRHPPDEPAHLLERLDG
jgi:DNA-binding transcriptional MerR regulator